jgi:phospholipid transport system substrate-binding protein
VKKILSVLIGLSLLCACAPVFADDASDVDKMIKSSMDEVLSISKRKDIKNVQKRNELWKVVTRTFDFNAITELALGQFSSDSKADLGQYADRRFTKDQQNEFRELFTRHLSNTYLDRMDLDNLNVKIDLKPSEILEPKKGIKRAQVATIINNKTPIDYVLMNDGKNDWKVYDVKVEGRSLVSAFRSEYKNILIKNKPTVLIQMLKDKIAQYDKTKKKS